MLQALLALALALPLVAAVAAAAGVPLGAGAARGGRGGGRGGVGVSGGAARAGFARLLVCVSPLYVWLGAVKALPHKEERFLYVAYPLVRGQREAKDWGLRSDRAAPFCSSWLDVWINPCCEDGCWRQAA